MTTDLPEPFDLATTPPTDDRLRALRELFPETVSEGKVDVDALRRSLGDWIDAGPERFGLTWPGKAECMRVIQEPSIGTLVPMPEESVNWDASHNVFIEGENLEVLKLLQKAYYGKVKLIYIDPPYNTGKEFIYPDNFKEGLADYLRYSGQVNEQGFKLTANAETDGRYHSKWLSMLYPRLYLARNLLSEDGLIFVSIDDHEQHNLRLIMNEIFGEENFLTLITWRRKKESSNDGGGFSVKGEYILAYRRSPAGSVQPLPLAEAYLAGSYREPTDTYPEGRWRPVPIAATRGHQSGGYRYKVTTPSGRVMERVWLYPEDSYLALVSEGRIYFGEKGDGVPQRVMYAHESRGTIPDNLWLDVATNKEGKNELTDLIGESEFITVKPRALIDHIIQLVPGDDFLVLDFFAGTGTTAHAVMGRNAVDGGSRRFCLVQLPEPMSDGAFHTISELTRVRIRRAGEAVARAQGSQGGPILDVGMRAYRLQESNFKIWDASAEADTANQLAMSVDHVKPEATERAILTELLLKAGYPLTSSVERAQYADVEGYTVADGALLLCLSDALSIEAFEAMVATDPAMILILDAGFGGDDELKVNALQTVRARNQQTGSDIALRVV